MRQKSTRTLFEYWNTVRGDRLAPGRYEIEPARIGPILSESMIIERPDDQTCRFRLAGTRICDHFGRELRGVDFLDLWDAEDAATLSTALAAMAEKGSISLSTFEASQSESHKVAGFEMMLLPLTHLEGTIDRFLGIITPTNFPFWLGSFAPERLQLVEHELIWPDGRPYQIKQQLGSLAPPPLASSLRKARIVRQDRRQFLVYEGGRREITRRD